MSEDEIVEIEEDDELDTEDIDHADEQEAELANEEAVANAEEDKEPEKKLIVDDPYTWEDCQVTMGMVWHPYDGHDLGRLVVISGRTHQDAPIVRSYREGELDLMDAVGDIRHELMMSLDARKQEYEKRKAEEAAKAAEAEAKRKEYQKKAKERSVSTSNYTPPPAYPKGLLDNEDAMNNINASKKLLEMLEKLHRAGETGLDYKNFTKTNKSNWVLEWSFMNIILLDQPGKKDRVLMGPKGQEIYDAAMAWKPGEAKPVQTKQEKKEENSKQQMGLF